MTLTFVVPVVRLRLSRNQNCFNVVFQFFTMIACVLSLRLLRNALFYLTGVGFLFSCHQEDPLRTTQLTDEVDLESPVGVEKVLDVPHFEYNDELRIAKFSSSENLLKALKILAAQGEDQLLSWSKDRYPHNLYCTWYKYIDSASVKGLPLGLNTMVFSVVEGEVDLVGIPVTLAVVLDRDGMVQIGDRVMAITSSIQVSTVTDSVSLLREAIRSGSYDGLSKFHVSYVADRSPQSSSALVPRRERIQDAPCGTDQVSFEYLSESQLKRDGEKRRHRLRLQYFFFSDPQLTDKSADHQAFAWQSFSLLSKSYKGRNNKYRTNHYASHQFTVKTEEDVGAIGRPTSKEFSRVFPHKEGKAPEFITFITGLPGTGYGATRKTFRDRVIAYGLLDIDPGSGYERWRSGTWGTHRGMGDRYKIRYECR